MTQLEYKQAKEIADTFLIKGYAKEDAALYMLERNMFSYRFSVEVLTYMG